MSETTAACPHCGKTEYYLPQMVYKIVNPHGEYVEGYGHATVMKVCGSFRLCMACGWREGGNTTIITRAEMEAM